MPAFRVQGKSQQNGASSSTTVAVTLTNVVGVNNSLKVSVGWASNNGDTVTGVTDDKSNTYTLVDLARNGSSAYTWQSAYLLNAANSPQTVTATISSSRTFAIILVDEYSGVRVSSAIDGHAINDQGSSTPAGTKFTSGNITPTTNGDLIYGSVVNISGAGNQSADTALGYTSRIQANNVFTTEDRIQASAAAVAATFTHTATDAPLIFIMAFRTLVPPRPLLVTTQARIRAAHW